MLERLIFGCGHLTSGPGQNVANRLVASCLEAGVRSFDTAPLYGFGTADRALARALPLDDRSITIHTKVGLDRPRFGAAKAWAKGMMQLAPSRAAARRPIGRILEFDDRRLPRGCFDVAPITDAFEESLAMLGRQSADVLFLHEAYSNNLSNEAIDLLRTLQKRGAIGRAGLANGCTHSEALERLAPPDFLVQAAVPTQAFASKSAAFGRRHILHSVLKSFQRLRGDDWAFDRAASDCETKFSSILGAAPSVALAYILLAAAAPHARFVYSTVKEHRLIDFLSALLAVTKADAVLEISATFHAAHLALISVSETALTQ